MTETKMQGKVHELRPRPPESEKVTINLGFVDLGQIDLLVDEAFYSNRTDFIRTAIRNQLVRHDEQVKASVSRRRVDVGLRRYTRADFEAVLADGRQLDIVVLGLVILADDISPELAKAAIGSVQVLGALQASPAVKAALQDRLR